MSQPPGWPEYASALERGLDALEDDLAGHVHDEPISSAIEPPDEPIPPHLRERIAVLASRLERVSVLVAAQMVEVTSRGSTGSAPSIPMFIDQRL